MFVGLNTYLQGIWKTRVGAYEKCQAWSKYEHFSSRWHPPRNWHDLCHTVIEFEQPGDCPEEEYLGASRFQWKEDSGNRCSHCIGPWMWSFLGLSIYQNQTRFQVIPTSCNFHIFLPFTVFRSFWVFSLRIFIANLHLQSQTPCLTNTCQMPPLNTAKMAWEVPTRHSKDIPMSLSYVMPSRWFW